MAKDSKTRGAVLSSLRRVAKKASKNSQRFTNLTGQLARALSKVRVKRFKSTLARALSKVRVKRFKSTLARALSKVRVKRFKSKAATNVSNDVDARAENNIPMAQDSVTLILDLYIKDFYGNLNLEARRMEWYIWISKVIKYAIDDSVPPEKLLEQYMNMCKENKLVQELVKLLCLLFHIECRSHFHIECRSHFQRYLDKMVLPSLTEKPDESLLSEFIERWSNNKDMFKRLSQFFDCLNPNSIPLPPVLPLNKVGVSYFRHLVFQEFREDVTKAVLSLINKEGEGEQICRVLLKSVLDIFVELGMGLEYYETYFKASMIEDTASYYTSKALNWSENSCPDYMGLERMDSPQWMRLDEWTSWIQLVPKDVIHYIGSYSGVPGLESEPKAFELYMKFCKDHPPKQKHVESLCRKFNENCHLTFEDWLNTMVLPSLREKLGESLLRQFVGIWSNHKVMFESLSQFFHCLNPNSIPLTNFRPLNKVGVSSFRHLVFQELSGKVTDAVKSLIDQEREGEQIDQALLKNVLDIFVEIGMGLECYERCFEASMLKDTASYYSRKASNWILEDSCPDYMLKAEKCFKREKDRVEHYLHSTSEHKLLEIVQHELLTVHAIQLLEKEHSCCHASLSDAKDLIRMYSLFSVIPEDPVSSMSKQHVTDELTALVKQAGAASNMKAEKRDVVGLQEQVRKVIELHDKNHTLFHKALKEGFEIFCSGVAGSSSAELLATFCDNIVKKFEKPSDEDKQGYTGKGKAILL